MNNFPHTLSALGDVVGVLDNDVEPSGRNYKSLDKRRTGWKKRPERIG